jgi:hypothetical protein
MPTRTSWHVSYETSNHTDGCELRVWWATPDHDHQPHRTITHPLDGRRYPNRDIARFVAEAAGLVYTPAQWDDMRDRPDHALRVTAAAQARALYQSFAAVALDRGDTDEAARLLSYPGEA